LGWMREEHVYTWSGIQRPVVLQGGANVARFCLEVGAGGDGVVQATHDPVESVKKGKALWETLSGLGEGLYGVTAIRVVARKIDGWMTLMVEQEVGS
jgi:hypothetical protein